MIQERLSRNSVLEIWNKKPRRLSEIWKFDRKNNLVIAMGLKGVIKINPIGSAIWLRLDGEHTVSGIAEELVKAYPEQDQNQIKNDIVLFINNMVNNRLVIPDWDPLGKES